MNIAQTFIIRSADIRKNAVEAVKNIRAEPLMQVEIKEFQNIRSLAQNSLMWKWYSIISKETGTPALALHEEMKVRILGIEEKYVLDELIRIPKSTKKLKVKGMTDFLHAVEALANELNISFIRDDEYKYAMNGE